MGTSSSYQGKSDNPGLLPKWVDDNGDNEPLNNDGDDVKVNKDPKDVDAQPIDSKIIIPQFWKTAKSAMTRHASTGKGAGLNAIATKYVRAKGGAKKASATASSGKMVTSRVGGFLSSAAKSGVHQAFEEVGIKNVIGEPLEVVLTHLLDAIAPPGTTKEESSTRRASIDVIECLYEMIIAEGGDLNALEQMDEKKVETVILLSVSSYIYNRWLDELGFSIEKGAISEAHAVQLEKDIKNYVSTCVHLEIGSKKIVDIDWNGREGQNIIERIYDDAYSILEAGS